MTGIGGTGGQHWSIALFYRNLQRLRNSTPKNDLRWINSKIDRSIFN